MSRIRVSSLLLLLLVGCLPPKPSPTPGPDVVPSSTFGFETSIPPTITNKADAVQLAAVFEEFARLVELDGNNTEHVLGTTKDLETRLASMGNYVYDGHRLSTDAFVSVVKSVQERELPQGEAASELTPELRKKAVEIYRAVAYGLRKV